MRIILKHQLDTLTFADSQEGHFNYLCSFVRVLLQNAAMAAFEFCHAQSSSETIPTLADISARLFASNDGDLVSTVEDLLYLLRDGGWSACAPGWHAPGPRPSGGGRSTAPLRERAQEWVRFRNNRPGHGITNMAVIASAMTWLPSLAADLLEDLADILPQRVNQTDALELKHPTGAQPLRLPRLHDGNPILVRNIKRRGSVFRVEFQTLHPRISDAAYFDIDDSTPLVVAHMRRSSRFVSKALSMEDGTTWRPTVLLPQRQTVRFRGRRNELDELTRWFNEVYSRACLVLGEGGIGKTTLVLEFLNGLLENPPVDLTWRPNVICFFSAKQTRWGANGLEQIGGVSSNIAEAARLLARLLEDRLDRSWFDTAARGVIDRTTQLFRSAGLKRDDVLLILDNTETLARTREEESEFNQLVDHVTSRLGRVLMTSRRRETVEARLIRIDPLDEQTAIDLLRSLAGDYGAEALRVAGDATLRRVARQLGGKPLLLDVLARLIGVLGISIENGMQRVLAKAAADLGSFLFDDAWARINEGDRDVFLVIGQLGDDVDGECVGWACSEVGVPHSTWLEAFEETRFGSLVDYGTHYDLALSVGMSEFLAKRYAQLRAEQRCRIDSIVAQVQQRRRQLLEAQSFEVTDRVHMAFRTNAAKMAKRADRDGNPQDAVVWFQQAIEDDSENAALFDRFAWYLMVRAPDLHRARTIAERACAIDRQDQDAHFTNGMIAARLGDIAEADRLLGVAVSLGKPSHLCALQRARARIDSLATITPPIENLEGAKSTISVAIDLLQDSIPAIGDRFYAKHLAERARQLDRARAILRRLGG